jgi:hypothetical protein
MELAKSLEWAKAWRSDCIDLFALAEQQLGELLNALNKVAGFRGLIKLRQPTKPSFQELRKQLQAGGHGKQERRRLDRQLDALERLLDWRPSVTHGYLDVRCCQACGVMVTLRHPEEVCTGAIRTTCYTKVDAVQKLESLRGEVERFKKGAAYLKEQLAKTPRA